MSSSEEWVELYSISRVLELWLRVTASLAMMLESNYIPLLDHALLQLSYLQIKMIT